MLDSIQVPEDGAIICTLYSESGLGKTTLASKFPSPVFIRAEDGLVAIPRAERPAAFPKIGSSKELFDQLKALIQGPHEFKTVVIDTISVLEEIFINDVVSEWKESNPMKVKSSTSIKTVHGGYGAGYEAVANLHGRVRKAAELLKDKGINVVFLIHSTTEILDLPDCEPYTRYTFNMNKRSLVHYKENVDLVGFIKLETFAQGEKEDRFKKAVSAGQRVLVCYAVANNVSKNRFGIEEDILINKGENPLLQYIPNIEKGE